LRLDALQRRRENAISELQTEIITARSRKEAELYRQYGEHAAALRKEIRQQEAAIENTGKIGKMLKKITGAWQRSHDELNDKRRTLQNIEYRQREAMSSFENDSRRRVDELKARFDMQRQQMQIVPPAPEPITRNRPALQFEKATTPANPRAFQTRARRTHRPEEGGPTRER
jgi:chromosome segregation ATPase